MSEKEAVEALNPGGGIFFMMDEEDVQRILAFPQTMIGSDGLPSDTHPHPRLWGTFPRVLGHYVREVKLFSLEEAVRKMTSLPAACFGLKERGILKPGNYADLVIFDPDTIVDSATFDDPVRPAQGIEQVMVNGRIFRIKSEECLHIHKSHSQFSMKRTRFVFQEMIHSYSTT